MDGFWRYIEQNFRINFPQCMFLLRTYSMIFLLTMKLTDVEGFWRYMEQSFVPFGTGWTPSAQVNVQNYHASRPQIRQIRDSSSKFFRDFIQKLSCFDYLQSCDNFILTCCIAFAENLRAYVPLYNSRFEKKVQVKNKS